MNILIKEDVNLLMVDWSKKASVFFYSNAVKNAREIGYNVAEFIKFSQIDPLRTHCIGHSLGAHICGFIGKEIKLKRITGLDPAGRLTIFFNITVESKFLKKTMMKIDSNKLANEFN